MRQRSDYPTFSDEEIKRRHKTFYGLMEQEGVDALLFYGSGRYASDIYWLSDWPSSREAYLLMQAGQEPVILMQFFNHYPMARVMSWIKDVRWAGANTTNSVVDLFASAAWNRKRSAWSARFLIQVYNKLRETYPSASFVDLSGKLRMMRTVRSKEEIERIHLASKLTDQSIQALAEGFGAGLREDEIPAIIEPVYLKAGGYAGIHFMSSMPMREPDFPVPSQFHSKRKLQKGDASDHRNQRRLLGLQRADSSDFLDRRRTDTGVAKNACRRDGSFRDFIQGHQRRRDHYRSRRGCRNYPSSAATALTMIWFMASTNIRRSSKPRPANATTPAK